MNDRHPWYRLRLRMLVLVAVTAALVVFNVRGVHKESWRDRYTNVDSLNLLERFHATPGTAPATAWEGRNA